jgi:hypothetical protein
MTQVKLRSMETAPKDYTVILLKIPGRDYLTRGRWASDSWAARTNLKYADISFNEANQPTGWLPETTEYLPLCRPTAHRAPSVRGVYADIPSQWPDALTA